MKRREWLLFFLGMVFIFAFIVWTVVVSIVNVAPIGPMESSVGLSVFNGYFRDLVGVNMILYNITDWLGILPLAVALGFAMLGLVQLIKRKSLFKVDKGILMLGGFYLSVIAIFVIFEGMTVNCRPTLINGILEASYPSSTTLLFNTVMPTAIIELKARSKSKITMTVLFFLIIAITLFATVGRIISGVHWISDIIGGMLISTGLDLIYLSLRFFKKQTKKLTRVARCS